MTLSKAFMTIYLTNDKTIKLVNIFNSQTIKIEKINEYTRQNTKQISGTYGGQDTSLTHKYILEIIGNKKSYMIDHTMLKNLDLFISELKTYSSTNKIEWTVID